MKQLGQIHTITKEQNWDPYQFCPGPVTHVWNFYTMPPWVQCLPWHPWRRDCIETGRGLAPGAWPLASCVSLDKAPDFLDTIISSLDKTACLQISFRFSILWVCGGTVFSLMHDLSRVGIWGLWKDGWWNMELSLSSWHIPESWYEKGFHCIFRLLHW